MKNSPELAATEKAAGSRGPKRRKDWQATFLETYALLGIITRAARQANVDPSTVDKERKRNPGFALAMAAAREEAADNLESFAHKWATTGFEEKYEEITYDAAGKVIGKKVRLTSNVSATLLIFMLKAMRPEKYRETFRVENTGAEGGPIRIKVEGAAEKFFAELDRLAIPAPEPDVIEGEATEVIEEPAKTEPEKTVTARG